MLLHKVLGLTLLAVGVSVKLIVKCLLGGDEETLHELPVVAAHLMGYGVGTSILILLAMRYLHYGGRDSVSFGKVVMYYGVDPYVDRIASIWWWSVGLTGLLPIVGVFTGLTTQYVHDDPLILTGVHAALVLALVIIESSCAHLVQEYLIRQQRGATAGVEREALASKKSNYGT